MSGKYPGLVVGGPYAGRSITSDERTMTVYEIAPRFSTHTPQPEPSEHVYTWTHIGPGALWIHSTLTLHTALMEMANAYAREQLAIAKAAKGGRPPYPQGGQSPFSGTTSHID